MNRRHHRRYAFDLDAAPTRIAVLEYLGVVAGVVERLTDAIERGNAGRQAAIEELATLQVLAHYLARRLSDPADTTDTNHTDADNTDTEESA